MTRATMARSSATLTSFSIREAMITIWYGVTPRAAAFSQGRAEVLFVKAASWSSMSLSAPSPS